MDDMDRITETEEAIQPSRRDALRRLAGAVVMAYVVPEVLFLSAAHADEGDESSSPSAPAPSSPAPSGGSDDQDDDSDDDDDDETFAGRDEDDQARETCNLPRARGENTISISRSDMERAQEAVNAGYAKPLDQVWGQFISEYDGKVIGVEFLDRRRNPRYRFRAISNTGRLETVTISAQTGVIQHIVGC
jgi:hypothetical protein